MDKEIELLTLQDEYSNMFDEYDLNKFPEYWFNIDDVDLKIRVLKRAIENKKYIIDVEEGYKFIEGID